MLPRGLSGKESTCQCRRHGFDPWVGKILWRRKWQPTPVFLPGIKLRSPTLQMDSLPAEVQGKPCSKPNSKPNIKAFPDSSVGKESTSNAGDPSLIPGLGRSPGEGIGYPLQYSWPSLVSQVVENLPAMRENWVRSLSWEDPWRRERLPTPVFWTGEFQGLYSPWGHKGLDTTEQLSLSTFFWNVNTAEVENLRSKRNQEILITAYQ